MSVVAALAHPFVVCVFVLIVAGALIVGDR